MKNFEEFKDLWLNETNKIKIKKGFEHLVFIVVQPENLGWNFGIEKQLQTTLLQTSGGFTGAGTGHNQKLCHLTELNDVLDTCDEYTYAMIVSTGMVFDMISYPTSIESFCKWTEGDEFCRAHIIVHPDKPAFLHHQHMELNLDIWRRKEKPNLHNKWEKYIRSSDNFHDDYTPSTLKVSGFPTITNFSIVDRKHKAWSYGHLEDRKKLHDLNWNIIVDRTFGWRDQLDMTDNYFKILMTRMYETFYVENTENLGKLPDDEFNLIITPTAGYSGEVFADRLNFNGDIVFYDYCSENVDIKQNIVEMNMTMDDIKLYSKNETQMFIFNDYGGDIPHTDELKKRGMTFGTHEELRKLQLNMYEECDIEYKVFDVIDSCLAGNKWFVEKIKDKRVFMDISNIYGYHVSHVCYTFPELLKSFDKLIELLDTHTEHYYLRGTRPTKDKYAKR